MKKVILLFLGLQLITIALFADHTKLKMVYVEMKHCPWCHKMKREIFDDNQTLDKLSKMYTITKLVRNKDPFPPQVTPRYYPTTYIFSTDGTKLLDELPGYMEKNRFLDYLSTLYEIETHE